MNFDTSSISFVYWITHLWHICYLTRNRINYKTMTTTILLLTKTFNLTIQSINSILNSGEIECRSWLKLIACENGQFLFINAFNVITLLKKEIPLFAFLSDQVCWISPWVSCSLPKLKLETVSQYLKWRSFLCVDFDQK